MRSRGVNERNIHPARIASAVRNGTSLPSNHSKDARVINYHGRAGPLKVVTGSGSDHTGTTIITAYPYMRHRSWKMFFVPFDDNVAIQFFAINNSGNPEQPESHSWWSHFAKRPIFFTALAPYKRLPGNPHTLILMSFGEFEGVFKTFTRSSFLFSMIE